jgi:NAD(P)-dependent dehydrogenase (short-subunit alcohol dehydrogenase family)
MGERILGDVSRPMLSIPLGRIALPVDVARVVAFLASDDGGWVNGICFGLPSIRASVDFYIQVK